MNKLFGTDGIRSKAGEFPLDKKTIEIIGNSLAKNFRERLGRCPRFVIGRDTRESGEWIETAFIAGATAYSGECHSAGIITTPGVAFLAKKLDFDAGVVISASHNPFEDNGIKVFLPTGEKLDSGTEALIEKDVHDSIEVAPQTKLSSNGNLESAGLQKLYLDYLINEFKDLNLNGLKIVLDCANGAASDLAPKLFQHFGAETTIINNLPDGQNINRECGSLHIDKLQVAVIKEQADFGVAFDGDADRSLFVDENGAFIDGDAVLWIMALHLRETTGLNNDTVVATVMSNLGLEIALKSANINLLRTPVGDKYVLRELLETKSSVGGEQSGHIIFPQKSLVGDGMFTALYLLAAMKHSASKFSDLKKGFTQYPQILVNVKVKKKIPFEDVSEIANAAKQIETELGQKGRLLLRYSGTENLARVMIEGEIQSKIESQALRLANTIKAALG